MKISTQNLEGTKAVKTEVQSSLLAPSMQLPNEILTEPLYHKGEACVDLQDPEIIYHSLVLGAFSMHGIQSCRSLRDALKTREKRVRALTLREMDIACRSKMDVTSPFFWEGLWQFGAFITEGHVGHASNPFELRTQYNRGLAFRKTPKYLQGDIGIREKAEQAIVKILDTLTALNIPPWDGEIEHGFPVEMTKPEFLTFEQYDIASKRLSMKKTALEARLENDAWVNQSLQAMNMEANSP